MSIFGWSYPPGCSGPPDECYDDTTCACCGVKLPEDIEEDTPQWEGFCSAACQKLYESTNPRSTLACWRPMFDLLTAELGRDTPEGWSKSIYKGTSCGARLSLIGPDCISIDSIVEGTDECAETQRLTWPFTKDEFWAAIQAVEDDADSI